MSAGTTWEDLYRAGQSGLRHWPNEELLRFLGRTYFHRDIPNADERPRVLEVGCGNGPNLWALARAGFRTVGVDISPTVLPWARDKLLYWDAQAGLAVADVRALPFEAEIFNLVYDVQALECLTFTQLREAYRSIRRVLRPDARFFSVHIGRDTWDYDHGGGTFIDDHTFNNISNPDAIFPNLGTICMPTRRALEGALDETEFDVATIESVEKTYDSGKKKVQYHIVEAIPRS